MDSFQTRSTLACGDAHCTWYSLPALGTRKNRDMQRLPISIRILLENLLRNEDGSRVCRDHIEHLCGWSPEGGGEGEIPFLPSRVLMQDFTGVPAVVDLAAMRDALVRLGGDAGSINPRIPVDLVVDHSVQVERFGCADAFAYNAEKEMERNRERYTFLKWGQHSFSNFRVVPPATGICHQVNLEYLADVVLQGTENDEPIVCPDTLVGLDSHTTMINGAGVLGWGVGGIEAEAAVLGQPCYLPIPRVIGFELSGRLRPEATATDLVLSITRMLREKGVVGSFVEFFGKGLDGLGIADRATIANMTPEFGATSTYFPVDAQTLSYLAFTGRSSTKIALIEKYLRAQDLFRTPDVPAPRFSDTLHLDLAAVEPVLAGPKRPQDRIALGRMKETFARDFDAICKCSEPPAAVRQRWEEEGGAPAEPEGPAGKTVLRKPLDASGVPVVRPYSSFVLEHGAVVIAAITSCTNTSNPSVLLGAGIMARKAVERGLQVRPWVKASLAPGSRVVTEYLRAAGLMPYLQALRFHLVAYGCTTCIGNSGPLQSDVAQVVADSNLVVASVLSGNRNYEGRINPMTRANYLGSPML
ncbi:MAG TPA: aconitate hydratase AcnA, partial [Desulfosalsimonadaceae bacterium]|nr:aconitate hydratase AcnA [Desulfosalsimonadaceae bacterium]